MIKALSLSLPGSIALAALVGAGSAPSGFAGALVQTGSAGIDHKPVACVVADRFPRFEARFEGLEVGAARVVFQGASPDWYSVAMKSEGPAFAGVLPKPLKSLKALKYYIEVTDRALATQRTPDYTTTVVSGAGECANRVVAAALSTASIVLQSPAGVAAFPAGFAPSGIIAGAGGAVTGTAAGSAAGGGASAGAAGAAAGATVAAGGLSGGAIAGIAIGAAGAVAGAAAASGGDSSPAPTPAPTPVATPTPQPTPTPAPSTLAGRWVGTWRDNDANPQCPAPFAFNTTIDFTLSGSSIGGTMLNIATSVCPGPGSSFSGPISSGSISGTSVQFVATLNTVSPVRTFTFTGSVNGTSAGSTLTGTYVTTVDGFPQVSIRGTLTATKQ